MSSRRTIELTVGILAAAVLAVLLAWQHYHAVPTGGAGGAVAVIPPGSSNRGEPATTVARPSDQIVDAQPSSLQVHQYAGTISKCTSDTLFLKSDDAINSWLQPRDAGAPQFQMPDPATKNECKTRLGSDVVVSYHLQDRSNVVLGMVPASDWLREHGPEHLAAPVVREGAGSPPDRHQEEKQ
jgi:hypothetical protein